MLYTILSEKEDGNWITKNQIFGNREILLDKLAREHPADWAAFAPSNLSHYQSDKIHLNIFQSKEEIYNFVELNPKEGGLLFKDFIQEKAFRGRVENEIFNSAYQAEVEGLQKLGVADDAQKLRDHFTQNPKEYARFKACLDQATPAEIDKLDPAKIIKSVAEIQEHRDPSLKASIQEKKQAVLEQAQKDIIARKDEILERGKPLKDLAEAKKGMKGEYVLFPDRAVENTREKQSEKEVQKSKKPQKSKDFEQGENSTNAEKEPKPVQKGLRKEKPILAARTLENGDHQTLAAKNKLDFIKQVRQLEPNQRVRNYEDAKKAFNQGSLENSDTGAIFEGMGDALFGWMKSSKGEYKPLQQMLSRDIWRDSIGLEDKAPELAKELKQQGIEKFLSSYEDLQSSVKEAQEQKLDLVASFDRLPEGARNRLGADVVLQVERMRSEIPAEMISEKGIEIDAEQLEQFVEKQQEKTIEAQKNRENEQQREVA